MLRNFFLPIIHIKQNEKLFIKPRFIMMQKETILENPT